MGDKHGRLSAYCVEDYKMHDGCSLNIWLWAAGVAVALDTVQCRIHADNSGCWAHLGHS